MQKLLIAGRTLFPEVGGSVAAGLAGTFVAGPLGAVVGGMAGPTLTRVLRELASRLYARREQARVGLTALVAIEDIKARLDEGARLRADGFFEGAPSSADDVFEGVLVTARDTFEEKKLPYLGHLFASIAFAEHNITPQLAHRLVCLIEALSYRQLVMLAMISDEADRSLMPIGWDLPEDREVTLETLGLLDELYDLGRRGLISMAGGGPLDSTSAFLGVKPEQLRPVAVGAILVEAARLEEIPSADRVARKWDAPPTN